jgi:HAD superfamily hydrolase (TIGR01509 family)
MRPRRAQGLLEWTVKKSVRPRTPDITAWQRAAVWWAPPVPLWISTMADPFGTRRRCHRRDDPDMSESVGLAAVLFDMDGTLLDSRQALLGAFHDATTEVLGAPFPITREDADRIIQLSSRDVFPALAGGDEEIASQVEASFHRSYQTRTSELRLFSGVSEMLRALRDQSLALGVVTSKSRVRLDRDLEQNAISDLLDVSVCGDEVPIAKPDPAPIIAAMELLGAAPARVLFVGDGANDVLSAHAAGIRVVGAGYGFHPEACRAAGPDDWIEEPLDLLPLVTRILGLSASSTA